MQGHHLAKGKSDSMFQSLKVKVAQASPILCDPMDYSPPGSSVHGHSPDKNTGAGCHFLLQGIFLSRGLNPGLLHRKQILYHLNHWGRLSVFDGFGCFHQKDPHGDFLIRRQVLGLLHRLPGWRNTSCGWLSSRLPAPSPLWLCP